MLANGYHQRLLPYLQLREVVKHGGRQERPSERIYSDLGARIAADFDAMV
jgi:hypothetical protein